MREIKFRAELPVSAPDYSGFVQYYVSTLSPHYKCQGYIMRKVKNHPFANKRGYIPEHRLIMEERLGRFLTPRYELVHHIDGNRSNNDLSNLKLTSPIAHPKEHDQGVRNPNGKFVALDPRFTQEKYRLFNRDTGLTQIYTLSELISKTFRRAKFEHRGKWTGLKDKNGKEIYEGDITLRSDNLVIGVVTFEDGKFGWEIYYYKPKLDQRKDCFGRSYACQDEADSMKVIGNIYENGDLISTK